MSESPWAYEHWIDEANEAELREGLHLCRVNYAGLAKENDALRAEVARLREREKQLEEALTAEEDVQAAAGEALAGDGNRTRTYFHAICRPTD